MFRFRPKFRLRTLLVGIALLSIPCGYVRWQAKIVSQRAAEREWLEQQGARFVTRDELDRGTWRRLARSTDRPSRLRMFLGDFDVGFIDLPTHPMVARAEQAFPEASLLCWEDI